MCGNHDLIQTTTPDEATLIAARELAERAAGLHAGGEDMKLLDVGSGLLPVLPDVLPAVQIAQVSRAKIVAVVSPPVADNVVEVEVVGPLPKALASIVSTGAPTETKDSIEDALLAGFYAATAAARAAVVVRLAAVLGLPKGSDITTTRRQLVELLKAKKIKETDLAYWLKVESITPAITAALRVLSSRNRDTVKLVEVNNLRTALGLPAISASSNWKNEACGPMLVGKLYEKLQERGYAGELPSLFAEGLKKYRKK